jgi:hypothetical protein
MARYSKSASSDVKGAMKRRKAGTLKSGGSGKTVKRKSRRSRSGSQRLAPKARRSQPRNPRDSSRGARRVRRGDFAGNNQACHPEGQGRKEA